MKWFQNDTDAPNDPKLKAVIRKGTDIARSGHQAAAGAFWLLCCFVGNHGEDEPGLGTRQDGTPLDLQEMADECYFDSTDDLVKYLDFAADRNLIHRDIWQQRRTVFLPAMYKRAVSYAHSKGRPGSHYDTMEALIQGILTGTGQRRDEAAPFRPARTQRGQAGARKKGKRPLQDKTPQDITPGSGKGDSQPGAGGDLLQGIGEDQIDAAIRIWNDERKKGPAVRPPLEPKRRAAIGRMLKLRPDLNEFRLVVRWADKQPWLNAPGTGDFPNYRLTLDDLVEKSGKYYDRALAKPVQAAGGAGRDAAKGRTGGTAGIFKQALHGADQHEPSDGANPGGPGSHPGQAGHGPRS